MLGKNHVISSCSAWVLCEPYLFNQPITSNHSLLLLIVVGISSILADIDHPSSMLGRHVKFISIPLHYLQGDKKLSRYSEDTHSRGITHSIWMILFCWWLLQSSSSIVIGFAFGFIAHLIGDALTPAGVRIFWPVDYKLHSPITFKTGGIGEYLFTYGLFLTAFFLYF